MSICSTSPRNDASQPTRLAYGVDEWAALMGVGRTTAFNWIREGRIKAVKANGRTLITDEASRAFIASLPSITAA